MIVGEGPLFVQSVTTYEQFIDCGNKSAKYHIRERYQRGEIHWFKLSLAGPTLSCLKGCLEGDFCSEGHAEFFSRRASLVSFPCSLEISGSVASELQGGTIHLGLKTWRTQWCMKSEPGGGDNHPSRHGSNHRSLATK